MLKLINPHHTGQSIEKERLLDLHLLVVAQVGVFGLFLTGVYHFAFGSHKESQVANDVTFSEAANVMISYEN